MNDTILCNEPMRETTRARIMAIRNMTLESLCRQRAIYDSLYGGEIVNKQDEPKADFIDACIEDTLCILGQLEVIQMKLMDRLGV